MNGSWGKEKELQSFQFFYVSSPRLGMCLHFVGKIEKVMSIGCNFLESRK